MKPNGYYLHLDNITQLGAIYVHDHNPREKHSVLRPVFKVEKQASKEEVFIFHPGYMDVDQVFYNCPLLIFHVQIGKVIQTVTNYGHNTTLEGDFKIFSKDLSKHKSVNIKLDKWNTDFQSLSKIINLTNQFIESNRDIELIDFLIFNKRDLNPKDKSIIIEAVDNLQFDFFDNSMNRVGKDNYFWTEAEIRNLSKDKYLNKLILENLEKQCRRIETKDYGLFMEFDIDTAYVASYGRSKNSDSSNLEKKAKEILKLDMAISYNANEQLLEQLINK